MGVLSSLFSEIVKGLAVPSLNFLDSQLDTAASMLQAQVQIQIPVTSTAKVRREVNGRKLHCKTTIRCTTVWGT